MKKIILFVAASLALASCNKDDDFGGNSALQPVNFSVNLNYDQSLGGDVVNGGSVTLTNTNTGDIYTAVSNENGIVNFAQILPGSYNLTATQTLSASEFSTTFGYAPETEMVAFNGSQEQVLVNANVMATSVVLKSARIGDLVIKQIYYAGSHAQQGAVFRDQFIEIYNNSNEVIYADGLLIGQLHGKANTTVNSFSLPNGQFDWSKSIGMPLTGPNANTNFVYADYIMKIPGNGTQYPIQPGESIVIAQTAINHTQPLIDNNGDPVAIQNPALTIDLSTADFEAYLGDYRLSIGEDVYQWDIQNPAVTDVDLAFWGGTNKDLILDNLGRDSFIIFRDENVASYPQFPSPDVTSITSTTKYFKQIPVNLVIDGVDLQHHNPNSQRPKMLQSEVDASFIGGDASFNSQSVIRKTKTTINGRKVLEDTNNSSVDFVKLAKAEPRGFAQ